MYPALHQSDKQGGTLLPLLKLSREPDSKPMGWKWKHFKVSTWYNNFQSENLVIKNGMWSIHYFQKYFLCVDSIMDIQVPFLILKEDLREWHSFVS